MLFQLSVLFTFFFSSRRRHTRYIGDWSSDVCSSDLLLPDLCIANQIHKIPSGRKGHSGRRSVVFQFHEPRRTRSYTKGCILKASFVLLRALRGSIRTLPYSSQFCGETRGRRSSVSRLRLT